jgi:hypothetical protein
MAKVKKQLQDLMSNAERLRNCEPPFHIKKRPNSGPAVWERNGVEYTEEKAMVIARYEEKEKRMANQ